MSRRAELLLDEEPPPLHIAIVRKERPMRTKPAVDIPANLKITKQSQFQPARGVQARDVSLGEAPSSVAPSRDRLRPGAASGGGINGVGSGTLPEIRRRAAQARLRAL